MDTNERKKNRKELTSHGSKEFPIAIYETELAKNILGYVPWHWHEELQFCYVLRRSVDFHINSQTITLDEIAEHVALRLKRA